MHKITYNKRLLSFGRSEGTPFMKILIIQQKMIGDVLTSSILFKALREKHPEAQLHYLIYTQTSPVVENNPYIDRIIDYDPKENNKFLKFNKFLQNIKKENYEIVIDVYSKISTAIISKASGADLRISYHKWYTSRFYSKTIHQHIKSKTRAGLAIENRMLLLKVLNENFPNEIKPQIYLSEEEVVMAKTRLQQAGIKNSNSLIMVGVLGSSKEKTYPPQYLSKLLDVIVDRTGAQLLFNYIPKQKEEALQLFNLCKPGTQEKIHLETFGRSLREFLSLTSQCDALIGNEGGAINMAKALNIPTFSIFSPQISKEAWAMYEDDNNKSVHLKNYKPEFFLSGNKPKVELYSLFFPELIFPELLNFLKNIKLI